MKLRLYLGQKQAEIVQNYQTLGKVVSDAFGEGSDSSSPEDTAVPQTEGEMLAAFSNVFGK